MKAGMLVIVLVLICWFVLTPRVLRADENQWYQGQQGHWVCNSWRWESTHGDQWFQGRRGHWYQERDGWQWHGDDGEDYRRGRNGWQWYGRQQQNDSDRN